MSSEPITPATYSGVHVLQQADSYGQPVMRRAKDDYINATQILRAAGFPKTQRTKILERDISGGVHEKVQGGFHMFQGTWVPLETGVKLARKHGVEELLAPLFEFVLTDGLHSDIFKNMGKFGKPYRGPVRPRVEARPASQRLASTSVAALIFDDSSEDDEDLGALDFDDDEDEDENDADDDDTRFAVFIHASPLSFYF
ncbi:transcription regulator HTH, apses-type DNA-binding domain-containing protein [Chytriomyces sp. MP71]|nr:transcription regulator HTH, apses-type DNA-binding domain-containing protein [Chytriomyces sp. MP71]